MKLYEYDELFLRLIESDNGVFIDSETGEVFEAEELEKLAIEKETKQENVALYIKELKAEAEALKAEKKRIDARISAAENRAEYLKNYLMGSLNGEKFKTARVAVSYRKSSSVEVTDEAALEDKFFKIEKKVSKTAIKEAIEAGETVKGAHIEEKQGMIIK